MLDQFPGFLYVIEDPRQPGCFRYIGQTQSPPQRWTTHRQMLRKNPETPLYAWWLSVLAAGVEPRMRLLWEGPAEELNAREVLAIKAYRDLGFPLLNQNDGGIGNHGFCPSTITRLRMSKASKGKPKSAEMRRKLSQSLRGKPKSPEHVAAMLASRTESCRAKLRAAWTPERRAMQADVARAAVITREQRRKSNVQS